MLNKLINFSLAYCLIIIRFVIIAVPIFLCFYPIAAVLGFSVMEVLSYSLPIILGAIFFVNCYVILYLLADMFFGISIKHIIDDRCMKCSDIPKFKWILPLFATTKEVFYHKNVELYIKTNLEEVNAYAVGNPRKDYIILTTGLLELINLSAETDFEKEVAIAGILGHEMSHIINRDFLPGLLIFIHQRIMNVLYKVCRVLVRIISAIISLIPILGGIASKLLKIYYELLTKLGDLLFKILLKIYDYVRIHLLRSIEYRSDMEAARAFGGESIALALSFLKGGYNSIFSAHPSTPSRIKKVNKVTVGSGYIKPHIVNSIVNFISVIIIFLLTIAIALEIRIWVLPKILIYGFQLFYSRIMQFADFMYFIYDKLKTIIHAISWLAKLAGN